MTLGEYRVGISFNPSQDPYVKMLKEHAAALIDLIDSVKNIKSDVPEAVRISELAMNYVEAAAMWAVKAATKGPMNG